MVRLLALLVALAGPATAQSAPPTQPEILATLVRLAPGLRAVDPGGERLDPGAAVGFVTLVLYELGIAAPQNDDVYSLTATCEGTGDPNRWACRVVLGVQWGDAESAWIAMFDLGPPGGLLCVEQYLDGPGRYNPCAWDIADRRIMLMLAG